VLRTAESKRRVGVAVVALALTSACGGTSTSAAPEPSSGARTFSVAGAEYTRAVRAANVDRITALFASDIVLRSPVLSDPFVGRARVTRLFGVLGQTFRDIHVTDTYARRNRFVLMFDARVGETRIEIVDLLRFDRAGQIVRFTVTARPLAGIQALAAEVAPHLAEIG
jgi:SnoaL-like domain